MTKTGVNVELANMLSKAIEIAALNHTGQFDKGGQPYILHPIRVMLACNTPEAKIVAMLHDIIEDTDITLDYLSEQGFTADILEAISVLTRTPGANYMEYIDRLCENRLATEVKYADLQDNMDISRLPEITERDIKRVEKYKRALVKVEEALAKHNMQEK